MPAHSFQFFGPFSWRESSRSRIGLTAPDLGSLADRGGVYLWTVPVNGMERVLYVGITAKSFKKRLSGHLSEQTTGNYGVYDPDELRRGRRVSIYPGLWNVPSARKSAVAADFKRRRDLLIQASKAYITETNVWVAPSDDPELAARVETAIHDVLTHHADGDIRAFLPPMTTLTRSGRRESKLELLPSGVFDGLGSSLHV